MLDVKHWTFAFPPMKLRRPSEQLAGVCWLPRFIDKARESINGTLPEEYAKRFGSQRGMDGAFLKAFGLTKENFVEAVRAAGDDDQRVADWFRAQPGVNPEAIGRWNKTAPEIGRPGRPEHEIVKKTFAKYYPSAPYTGVESVFEVIDADESRDL
jgi:hypothetical protein